jgi:hypothetical protein
VITDKQRQEHLVYLHDEKSVPTDYVEIEGFMSMLETFEYRTVFSSNPLDPYFIRGSIDGSNYVVTKNTIPNADGAHGIYVTSRSVADYFYVIFCEDETYAKLDDFLRGAGLSNRVRTVSGNDLMKFKEVYIHGLNMKYNPGLGLAELPENDPKFDGAPYDPVLPYETYKRSALWSWGNPEVIYALLSVTEEWGERYPGQKLRFGDMSMYNGSGGTHDSHTMGLSLDVGLIGIYGPQSLDISIKEQKAIYSQEKTEELIDLFIATGIVSTVKDKGFYFNDSNIYDAPKYADMSKRMDGHDNHLHFNFIVNN